MFKQIIINVMIKIMITGASGWFLVGFFYFFILFSNFAV